MVFRYRETLSELDKSGNTLLLAQKSLRVMLKKKKDKKRHRYQFPVFFCDGDLLLIVVLSCSQ